MPKKIDPPVPVPIVTIKKKFTRHTAEHEVLLSFNDDADAEYFHAWWYEYGLSHLRGFIASREELHGQRD